MDPSLEPSPTIRLLDVPIHGLTLQEFVELAVRRIRGGRRTLFSTTNVYSIVVAQRTPALRAHYEEAVSVLPDGILPVLVGRLRGGFIPERVAGPDFVDALLARAATEGLSVFFMGSTDDTLSKIVEACGRRYPGLRIAGVLSPPYGEFDAATDERIIARINAARPAILFVGLTAPKQEVWLSRAVGRLEVPFAMGVGAAFDFLAGNVKRAPHWIGQLGGEGVFRLVQEPRRLWRRSLTIPVFFWMVLRDALGRRGDGGRPDGRH